MRQTVSESKIRSLDRDILAVKDQLAHLNKKRRLMTTSMGDYGPQEVVKLS